MGSWGLGGLRGGELEDLVSVPVHSASGSKVGLSEHQGRSALRDSM